MPLLLSPPYTTDLWDHIWVFFNLRIACSSPWPLLSLLSLSSLPVLPGGVPLTPWAWSPGGVPSASTPSPSCRRRRPRPRRLLHHRRGTCRLILVCLRPLHRGPGRRTAARGTPGCRATRETRSARPWLGPCLRIRGQGGRTAAHGGLAVSAWRAAASPVEFPHGDLN